MPATSLSSLRGRIQIRRYQNESEKLREADTAKVVEHAVSAYINNHRGVGFRSSMVHICAPLAFCIPNEAHVYFCFESIMALLGTPVRPGALAALSRERDGGGRRVRGVRGAGQTTTWAPTRASSWRPLRCSSGPSFPTCAGLVSAASTGNEGRAAHTGAPRRGQRARSHRFNYFEEEDIDINEWAVSWLSSLLARELPLKCLVRLWDVYFADETQSFSLHLYVCLGRPPSRRNVAVAAVQPQHLTSPGQWRRGT